MKIAVAIETKDRRLSGGENYLGQTLDNLVRSGSLQSEHLHSLDIVSGGEQDKLFFHREISRPLDGVQCAANVRVHPCPADGCTRQQNGARAIRIGAQQDADWVMKLEDDLDFCGDFLGSVARWLEKYGDAAVPMFSLGATFSTVSGSRFQPGETIWEPGPSFPAVRDALAKGREILGHPVLGYWGAQALVWKRPVAARLAAWLGPDPFLFDGREQHRQRGHDLLLQVWGHEDMKARTFGITCPAFVQHIGRQSNIQNPFFEFPFAGREWSFGVNNA